MVFTLVCVYVSVGVLVMYVSYKWTHSKKNSLYLLLGENKILMSYVSCLSLIVQGHIPNTRDVWRLNPNGPSLSPNNSLKTVCFLRQHPQRPTDCPLKSHSAPGTVLSNPQGSSNSLKTLSSKINCLSFTWDHIHNFKTTPAKARYIYDINKSWPTS